MFSLSFGERFAGYGPSERASGEDGRIFPEGTLEIFKDGFVLPPAALRSRGEPLRLSSFDSSGRGGLERLEIRAGESIEFHAPSFVALEPLDLESSDRWDSVREYLGWLSVPLIGASCGTFAILIVYWNPRFK